MSLRSLWAALLALFQPAPQPTGPLNRYGTRRDPPDPRDHLFRAVSAPVALPPRVDLQPAMPYEYVINPDLAADFWVPRVAD